MAFLRPGSFALDTPMKDADSVCDPEKDGSDAASTANGRLPVRARLARVGKYAFSIFAAAFFPTFLFWLAFWVPNAADDDVLPLLFAMWATLCAAVAALFAMPLILAPRRRRWHRAVAGGAAFVLVAVWFCFAFPQLNLYNPFHPFADTIRAPGFSESTFFGKIRPGMGEEEVVSLLGQPLSKEPAWSYNPYGEDAFLGDRWRYTEGRSHSVEVSFRDTHFAWLQRDILFTNGVVKELHSTIRPK